MPHPFSSRSGRRTALTATAIALGIGLWQSVAGASLHAAPPPIEQGNSTCGTNVQTDPVIGTVNFKRGDDTVTLQVGFTAAPANDTYTVHLYENDSSALCTDLTPAGLGTITTNSTGAGHGNFTTKVPAGTTKFFVDPVDTAHGDNETPTVTLP